MSCICLTPTILYDSYMTLFLFSFHVYDVDTRYHNVPVKVIFSLIVKSNWIRSLHFDYKRYTSKMVLIYCITLQTLKLTDQDFLGEATCVLSEVDLFNNQTLLLDGFIIVVWPLVSVTALCVQHILYFQLTITRL